jgi:F-type H+-transporting ATPase subunit epsilon
VAHRTFPVEVLTPEGEVWNDEVEMISTRTGVGSIGILAHHQPLLAMLEPSELKLYTSESDYESFATGEGYLQMIGNRALILVEEALKPEDLDTSDLESKLRTAEKELEAAEDDSEEQRRAERDKKRWEQFLKLAGASSSTAS